MQNPDDTLPQDFDALLAPMPASEFFAVHWLKSHCHIPGSARKFARLLPWEELNRILEQHSLEPPRLRLVKSGKQVDPRGYTDYRYRDGQIRPKILAKEFTEQLRDGATLTLDHVDRVRSPLNLLAESLERFFGANVNINAYAAFRTCHGPNVHWDDHEVFILQVSGRKRWLLYGKEKNFDDSCALPPNPLWDHVLADGDLLYIPRGCWHVAIPLDEPCLHLTVGIRIPSAPEILSWIATELRSDEISQLCLARFAPASERLAFIDKLKNAVMAKLDMGMLDRYLETSNFSRTAAQHMSLPWAATSQGLPDQDSALVRLSGRREASLRADGARREFELSSGGKTWRFPLMMKPILEPLIEGNFVPLGELVAVGRETVGEQMARAFIGTLIKGGVVFLVGSNDHMD